MREILRKFEGIHSYVKVLEKSSTWAFCQRDPTRAILPCSVRGKLGQEKMGSEDSSSSSALCTFFQRDALSTIYFKHSFARSIKMVGGRWKEQCESQSMLSTTGKQVDDVL